MIPTMIQIINMTTSANINVIILTVLWEAESLKEKRMEKLEKDALKIYATKQRIKSIIDTIDDSNSLVIILRFVEKFKKAQV